MDPASPDDRTAPALRTALRQEQRRRAALEQENRRLRAGLARQNERVLELEAENAELRHQVGELRAQVAALLEQNQQLLQEVGRLRAAVLRLQAAPHAASEEHMPGLGPPKQVRETHPRRPRDRTHNRGRHRAAAGDVVVEHAVDACPRCGTALVGGWVHRRVQVTDLPAQQRAVVTEHRMVARTCPVCRRRVLPAPVRAGRVGQSRFGPRLIAAVATMHAVERLPGAQIQARLTREYGLDISHGGLIGLLHLAARHLDGHYQEILQTIRGSPVAQADETGWREDGMNGYLWMLRCADAVYFRRDERRTAAACDRLLGASFGGTLVTDFYAAYDHVPCPHQRCWSHLWRDITTLEQTHPQDIELQGWITGMRRLYQAATAERPPSEHGTTPEAERARGIRARRLERQLLVLCPAAPAPDRPEAVLIKRCRRYVKELFTFVADPAVPPTNNAAEQILRPIVVARKISGGTRSAAGSHSRMVLASVAGTAHLRHQNPHRVFLTHLTHS